MACEYCENLEPIIDVHQLNALIVEDRYISFCWCDGLAARESYVAINFCPMCGEKLGGADD